ncbi:MAG: hypothetical protein ACK5JF_02855 [Oscillospiraceae bacterium]
MAQAYKPTLTNAGRDLLNDLATGGTLTITRAQLGSGQLPEADPIEPLEELLDPQAEAQIKSNEASSAGKMVIGIQYDNKDLENGFAIYEIGIFAKSLDGPEVLYCYMTLGETPEQVPAAIVGRFMRSYDIPIQVDNVLDIVVQIDASALATTQDITKILDGTTPPANSLNAEKLGGKPPADYDTSPLASAAITDLGIEIASLAARSSNNYSVLFDAPADQAASTTYIIDGTPVVLRDMQKEVLDDAWKAGAPVTLIRRGEDAFFSNGGSSLKVRIRGGLTAPANGKPGDIWVKTDYPLSGKYVIGYNGLPPVIFENNQDGLVLLSLSTFSPVANYLQSIQGTPKARLSAAITGLAYREGNTSIKKVGFRVWYNGAWQQPFDYFYSAGTEALGLIGFSGTLGLTINPTNINVPRGYYSNSQWVRMGIGQLVEIGNLSSLRFNFSYGEVGYSGALCHAGFTTRPVWSGSGIANGTISGPATFSSITANVAAIEGIGYPGVYIQGGNTGNYTGYTLTSIVPTYL